MKIYVTGVMVDDQQKALDFYTSKLGFEKRHDIPIGEHRWLTVCEPDNPNGIDFLLEPNAHPAVGPFQQAMAEDGIPSASFRVSDVENEYERLCTLGVKFTQPPTAMGDTVSAVLDDTCGNLIQLIQFEEQ